MKNEAAAEVLDPVTIQVIRSAFAAAAEEMKTTMVRTAYNHLLFESYDFGCVITDSSGRLLAQSETLPLFLSVLPSCVEAGIKKYGREGFVDGDVVIANDPYTTGTHISDTAAYIPIFYENELVGFAGCMAHWADIGGKSPGGWCPDSTDVFQEGLRFDHLKLAKAGVFDDTFLEFIWGNVRLPFVCSGDFGATLATCKVAIRRVREIYQRYGRTTVERALGAIFDQSEAIMRAAIRQIPDGVYSAVGYLDHDGVDRDRELEVHVTIHVTGDVMSVDFAGSSPVARGPVNCPFPGVVAGVESAIKCLTIPFDRLNAGHRRPVAVVAPADTIVNPSFPAPVDSYGYVNCLVYGLVIRALAAVLPERCVAGTYQLQIVSFFRTVKEGARGAHSLFEGSFVHADSTVGGNGASSASDGASALANCEGDAPCPVAELLEARYPLRVERFELDPNSYGKGKFRGGLGTIKEYRVLEDGVFSQISIEGTHRPAWGLFGGGDAASSAVVVWPETEKERRIQDKVGFVGPFKAGDRLVINVGGGGGWGDPLERDPNLVRDDVLKEYCSIDQALAEYGVVVDPRTLLVDDIRTTQLRAKLQISSTSQAASRSDHEDHDELFKSSLQELTRRSHA